MFGYRLCRTSPGWCQFPFSLSACDTILAHDDIGAVINSDGGVSFLNVLQNDTMKGAAATSALVTIHFVSTKNPGIILLETSVIVASGTSAGNYTLTYQICSVSDPLKCSEALVNIRITATKIDAQDNTFY